ncbi:hypothetical protein [Sphingomonas morindae]|uniref:Uncharacterized protein n=1 Tax=Sphingomonas morindae TaxID=1541170 RepID=A0ABY4X6K0_9SPHN|nr:hypothetical protein [Sphingomonas morindae]USI72537.1 hypothetical protein LHA26_14805 [Sphingomonas morindae]
MGKTIIGTFPDRRAVELAVEHLVQDYGVARSDIFIEPAGGANSAGEAPAGADAESGHADTEVSADGAAYAGALLVSVDMNEDEEEAVFAAFRDAGAQAVRSR